MRKYLIVSLSLMFFLISVSSAQEIEISYQGRITDAGDVALEGTYSVTFSIYDQEAGGTLLWSETADVTATSGLFVHLLGSTTALSVSLFTDNAHPWLELAVGGETLSPRTPFVHVPYSASSAEAILAQSVPTGSITTTEIADGSINLEDLTAGASPGQIIKMGSFGWEYGEDLNANYSPGNGINITANVISLSQNGASPGQVLKWNGTTWEAAEDDVLSEAEVEAFAFNSPIMSDQIWDGPGIAHKTLGVYVDVVNTTTTNCAIDSIEITVPGTGYVVIEASGFVEFTHVSGTSNTSNLRTSLSHTTDVSWATSTESSRDSDAGSGRFTNPFNNRMVDLVPSGGTYKYYFNAYKSASTTTARVHRVNLLAVFYPTAYGTVQETGN